MTQSVEITHTRSCTMPLNREAVRAHTIVSSPQREKDNMLKTLKPKSIISRLVKPVLGNIGDVFGDRIEIQSVAVMNSTVEMAAAEAKSVDKQCKVTARAHNPDNRTVFDGMLDPMPTEVSITCNAADCCMSGLERVATSIQTELNASRLIALLPK